MSVHILNDDTPERRYDGARRALLCSGILNAILIQAVLYLLVQRM